MQRHWKPVYVKKHQKCPDLDNLVTGVIPAIILKNAISKKSCKQISEKIIQLHQMSKYGTNSKHIGVSLNSHLNSKDLYFEKTRHLDEKLKHVFSETEDPRFTMHNLLSVAFDKQISPARENGNLYSNGIFRIHDCNDSFHVHRDNASFEACGFNVAKLTNQLSSVLHLQTASSGGELVLYQKIWKRDDEKFRFPDFGYSKDVISNSEFIKIKPDIGDVIIINPIHYHAVSRVVGVLQRISVGFFLGQATKSTLFCWS